ncbi:MAG: serine/threonine-protein kinase [Candidatus Eremiobacterota bacterium]
MVEIGLVLVAGGVLLWLFRRDRAQPPPDLERVFRGTPADRYVGCRLGPYRLVGVVGKGSSAVVYRAVPDETLDAKEACAVKVLNPELSRDSQFRARFQREIQILRRLKHPGIVRMDDFGEFQGLMYLVTELVPGLPLRKTLLQKGLSLDTARSYFSQLAEAVYHAHSEGVIHRNVKPENVMVRPDGTLKLVDFGLARPLVARSNITLPGAILGTPAYMAPEQITGGELTSACDQYSLGIVLFEMLGGRRPFQGNETIPLLMQHISQEIPSLHQLRPELPPAVDAVVARMIAKEPAQRFGSVKESLDAFTASLAGSL